MTTANTTSGLHDDLQGRREQITGATGPGDFGTAGFESQMADNVNSVLAGVDSLQVVREQIIGAVTPGDFGIAGLTSQMAASVNPVLAWSNSLPGFQEQIIGAAIPDDFGIAGLTSQMADNVNPVLAWSDSLPGFQEQLIDVAMPDDFGIAGLTSQMAASVNPILAWSDSLPGFQEQIIGAAMPGDFGAAGLTSQMAASVNPILAWSDSLRGLREELASFSDRWMGYVEPMLESSKAFTERFLEDQERFGASCMKLGQRGWFLDPEMPMSLLWYLGDTIDERPEIADELLSQWFQERLDEIEEALIKACPRRALLLRSAFKAHRERDYNNSIPTLLKEADGMWHDLFGLNVFVAKARKSIVKTIEDKQPYGLVCSSLVPLLQSTLPLWMNEGERHNWMKKHRTDSFQELNRHEVLHGISVDYGTETNSLKAISFLNWRLLVGFFL